MRPGSSFSMERAGRASSLKLDSDPVIVELDVVPGQIPICDAQWKYESGIGPSGRSVRGGIEDRRRRRGGRLRDDPFVSLFRLALLVH